MEIKLENVVLSYPKVFKPEKFGDGTGNDEPKYSAAFILHKKKNATEIAKIKAGIETVRKEKPLNGVKTLTGKPLLREGTERTDEESESGYAEGYGPDVLYINASNTRPPRIVNRSRADIKPEQDLIYGGALVNVSLRLWGQSNGFGKRVNASLEGIQYVGEGNRYGAPPINVEKVFEDISGEDDENP